MATISSNAMVVISLIAVLISFLPRHILCSFPFQNTSLRWDDRVDDIVSRLSLKEIMLQMSHGGAGVKGGPAPAIERLGIGPYQWNEECLHGAAKAGEATAFPQAIGLAAAFSPQLIFDIAEATGVEVRAKHNDYVKRQEYGDHKGLSCFSPVINIMRHPLWGRNQETYGEDPYLSGVYAAHFVRGLQGDHFRYVRANAGCKHFDVHGGPENIPESRFSFDAKVSERDWRLTFQPAFRQCVLAGSYSLMCSFNNVNGIPACANHELLTKKLRAEWGFKGYVISDEAALEIIVTWHNYTASFLDAAVASVTAGCNIELSGNNPAVYSLIVDAVNQGKLSEILVRERVKPLFYTRMRLGEFDPPEMNPYLQYNMSLVQSPAHRALAVKAAMQTFVLLKNADGLLPIKKHFNSIAVVGPMADNLGQAIETEDNDRRDMMLPGQQAQIIQDTITYAPGVPILLLVFSAGPVNISDVDADPQVSAIMQCFFPAQATGEALYNVITMATDDASPAGRLPYTWYDTADQIPSMTEYTMTGRTYRYFKGSPLYPFGYGLSYTKFQYLTVSLIPVIQAGDDQFLFGELMNAGEVSSYEVVQVYMSWRSTNERMPQLQLAAFDRYFVSSASTQEFKFVITPEQMAVWTDAQGFVVQPGFIDVYIGGQQPNQARSVGSNILTTSFQIVGQVILGPK